MPETTRNTPTPSILLPSDLEFDAAYDERVRELSEQHWTPVRIAARAAHLLTHAGATRILDVGAGVGKFCIVGALSTDAHFVGVEWRGDLVEIARRTAVRFGAARASFVHASVDTFAFDGFDGFYLYNPFYEQISSFLLQIDGKVERSALAYRLRAGHDEEAGQRGPTDGCRHLQRIRGAHACRLHAPRRRARGERPVGALGQAVTNPPDGP
jgi:SAM-dependent methyltransferase